MARSDANSQEAGALMMNRENRVRDVEVESIGHIDPMGGSEGQENNN